MIESGDLIQPVTALLHRKEIRAGVTPLAIVQLLSTVSHMYVYRMESHLLLTDLFCSKPLVQADHETRTVNVPCLEDKLLSFIMLCLCIHSG